MTMTAAAVRSHDQLARTAAPLNILLLEDSALDAELIEARLDEAAFDFILTRVEGHVDFNEALAGCRYNLILSDYNVPGFDGVAALAAAHLACPDVPFLFVSGALGEDKAIELLKRGATDYVLKDRLERLVPSVERALREAREKTERVALATRLRESEAQLRLVMDTLPALVSFVGKDERYRTVNKAFEDWFGLPSESLLGRTLEDVLGQRAYEALRPHVRRALAGEHVTFEQHRVPYRLGSVRDVRATFVPHRDAEGAVDGYVALLEDITERRRMEEEREALLEREMAARAEAEAERQKLHSVFMQAPVAICILEGPRHVFTFANPAYRALVSGRDVVGKPLLEALPDVRENGFDTMMDRVLSTGEPFSGKGVVVKLDHHVADERLIVDFIYQPKRNARGEVDGILAVVTDVTEAVQSRRRLEVLAEELKQRADFEQQLIGIVSHDLRNPLNAISISANLLVRDEGLGERSMKGARRILSSAERAARMIRDLLDFTQARLGGGIPVERKSSDLHNDVSAALEELQHTHPERELQLIREGDTRGEWDPDRIAQVVTNLVGNALKYSAAGTPVAVRIRGDESAVVLEVHNRGEPIAPERLPHLFKPLSRGAATVDVQTRSIGLGLYIVDSIVRAHGGRVEARSTAADGTTFTVWLPRTASLPSDEP